MIFSAITNYLAVYAPGSQCPGRSSSWRAWWRCGATWRGGGRGATGEQSAGRGEDNCGMTRNTRRCCSNNGKLRHKQCPRHQRSCIAGKYRLHGFSQQLLYCGLLLIILLCSDLLVAWFLQKIRAWLIIMITPNFVFTVFYVKGVTAGIHHLP